MGLCLHLSHSFVGLCSYYGIFISELPVIKHEPHKECAAIRREVESTFEKVSSHMNYGYSWTTSLHLNALLTLGEGTCVLLIKKKVHQS